MNLYQQLMTFKTVAETNSFALAAKRLHLTATAISKQIKQLETHWDVLLFDRHTRSVCLTPFGRELYAYCQKLEQDMQHIDTFVTNYQKTPQGLLRVLQFTEINQDYYLSQLARYHQCFPQVQIDTCFSEEILRPTEPEFDLYVGFPFLPFFSGDYKYQFIANTDYVFCASPEFLAKHATIKSLDDLQQLDYIEHHSRLDAKTTVFCDNYRQQLPKPRYIFNQHKAFTAAAVKGLGFILYAKILLEPELNSGQLVTIPLKFSYPHLDICLFYRQAHIESLKINTLVNLLCEDKSSLFSICQRR